MPSEPKITLAEVVTAIMMQSWLLDSCLLFPSLGPVRFVREILYRPMVTHCYGALVMHNTSDFFSIGC